MSLLTLLVLFVRFDNVLVDLCYDMAGNRCERLPVAWQVPFQLSPFEPTSFGSLPEILGWIQEVSQLRLPKKQVKIFSHLNTNAQLLPTPLHNLWVERVCSWSQCHLSISSQYSIQAQCATNITEPIFNIKTSFSNLVDDVWLCWKFAEQPVQLLVFLLAPTKKCKQTFFREAACPLCPPWPPCPLCPPWPAWPPCPPCRACPASASLTDWRISSSRILLGSIFAWKIKLVMMM